MIIEIYADIFFIINFTMNFFIFWISAIISKNKIKILKIFIGSLIVTLLYLLMFFNVFFYKFYSLISGQLILLIGILFIFSPKKIYDLIIHIIRTNIIAILFSGVIFWIAEFINQNNIVSIYKFFSFKIMILSSIFVYILITIFKKYISRTLNIEKYCDIEIFFNNKSVKLSALIDTGNELKDPLTGRSAIIAQTIDIGILFDSDTFFKILKNKNIEILLCEINDNYFLSKIRLIPFKSIDNDRGMMIGFISDSVKIKLSNGKEKIVNNVAVGLYNGELSPKRIYKAIIDYDSCNF